MSGGEASNFPRVSVDSLQDLQRIQSGFNEAALAILDAKLKQASQQGHRDAYLAHLQQFIDRTFDLAKPNLRVNGRNFDEYDENEQDIDQFDEALDRRVWSLSDQRLRYDLEIAKKRRGVPLEMESLMRELVEQQRTADSTRHAEQELTMDVDTSADDEDDSTTVCEETSSLVKQLQQTIPAELERAQRVKQVEKEIKSIQP